MKTCNHPDCRRGAQIAEFACGAHWYGLPIEIRNDIVSTLDDYLANPSQETKARCVAARTNGLNHFHSIAVHDRLTAFADKMRAFDDEGRETS